MHHYTDAFPQLITSMLNEATLDSIVKLTSFNIMPVKAFVDSVLTLPLNSATLDAVSVIALSTYPFVAASALNSGSARFSILYP